MSFDLVDLSNTSICEQIYHQKVLDISGNMETIWEFARKAIALAQKSWSKQVDKHRKDISYAFGDKTLLSTRNIIIDQSFKKLNHKMLGLFEVIRN